MNMNASRIIFSNFSLWFFSFGNFVFFCVGYNFFTNLFFFKSDQAYREAMDGGARDSNLRSF